MKTCFTFLKSWAIFAIAVFTLFSCKKQNSDYLQSIPADADMVVSLNLQNLIEKGDIASLLKNPRIEKTVQQGLNNLSPESRTVMEEILRHPQEAGLSLKDNIVFFFNITENEFGLLSKIEDRKKFENTLSALFSANGSGQKIGQHGNGCFLEMGNGFVCAFDDDKAVLFGRPYLLTGMKDEALQLLNQKKEQSLLSNDGFTRFLQSKKDIDIWVSLSVYTRQNPVYTAILPEGLTNDMYITHHIDFQQGKIVDNIENLCGNSDGQKSWEHFLSFIGNSANDFLPYFPENTWGIWSLDLNGKKLYDILSENPYFALMSDNVSGEIDLQGLIGSIDGNITVGMTGLSANDVFGYMPHLTLLVAVKDHSLLDFLKQNLQLLNVSALADNQYKVNWSGTDIYFGLIDKHILYISTDTKVPRKAAAPFSETPAAKIFKSGGAMAIDMKPLRQCLSLILPAKDYSQIDTWLSTISSIESQSENLSGKLTIHMSNVSENALSTILRSIESRTQP